MKKDLVYAACTDNELIRLFQKTNSSHVFEVLIGRHKRLLQYVCFKNCKDTDDVKDIIQETHMKVAIELSNGRFSFENGTFHYWMSKIATNIFLDKYRKAKRSRGNGVVDIEEIQHTVPNGTIDDLYLKIERKNLIDHLLEGVSEHAVESVDLILVQGYGYQGAADMTGLNLNTVKSKIYKERLNFKQRFSSVEY